MAANRIMRDGGEVGRLGRRLRRGLLVAAAILALASLLAACGGGDGDPGTAAAERAADADVLNGVLTRQEAAVLAYADALRGIPEPFLGIARQFQAQESEHVDATLNALRELGEPAEPEAEEIPRGRLRQRVDYLRFLYELESGTIDEETRAVGRLADSSARTLLTATISNQAQHLVLLRRALGAKPAETVPEAFENGTAAAP